MKRERRTPLFLVVVCLVVAAPFAWGEGSVGDLNPRVSARLSADVTLCHFPPENPANARTMVVGQAAVADHLAHGDYLGECRLACDGVTCTASDQCHDIGTCDPATGACSNPNAADGTACDDGDPATTDDQCACGVCVGTVVCDGAPSPVPKTGQTRCWLNGPPDVDCAGTGQDGEYQAGISVSPRFTDNLDGTVKDTLTGLIWLKNANCFGRLNWPTALSETAYLAWGACGLTDWSVAGDWRLPNVKELQSLLDFGQYNPALPVGHPFSGVQSSYYWSSSSLVSNPILAWYVHLNDGIDSGNSKTNTFHVWPVRGGP